MRNSRTSVIQLTLSLVAKTGNRHTMPSEEEHQERLGETTRPAVGVARRGEVLGTE